MASLLPNTSNSHKVYTPCVCVSWLQAQSEVKRGEEVTVTLRGELDTAQQERHAKVHVHVPVHVYHLELQYVYMYM